MSAVRAAALAALAAAAAVLPAGCGSADGSTPEPPPFAVSSPGVGGDGRLAAPHTCGGTSPAVAWSGVPAGTRELVVTVRREGTARPSARWMVVAVPAAATGLPEGLTHVSRDAGGIRGLRQGVGDRGRIGHDGPCGARDRGRYTLRVAALSRPSRLGDGFTEADLRRALRGAVLAEAVLPFTHAP